MYQNTLLFRTRQAGDSAFRRGSIFSALLAVSLLLFVVLGIFAGCDESRVDTSEGEQELIIPAGLTHTRWVELDGTGNTRDLGGYEAMNGRQVRWNVVYRSAHLGTLSEDGCARFKELGVKTVIDMRNRLSPVSLFGGDVPCVHEVAKVLLLPVLIAEEVPIEEKYSQTVRDYADEYREMLELVAQPERLPLLFHCAAGKDRSGILAALLLSLLGVERETIMDEYMLSGEVCETLYPEAMRSLLDTIEGAGGIETYLQSIGIEADTQAAIQANLLTAN